MFGDTIFCLMMWIHQKLEIKGNVVVHLITKSYFVCVVWFLIQMTIYMFVVVDAVVVWIRMNLMIRHVIILKCDDCETCDDCGRSFLQQFCFESHKAKKLNGEYASCCEFLCTLLNCDDCRRDFSLVLKCRHFGRKKRIDRNVFFSNEALQMQDHGPSKYVKCGYCSDFYIKGFSGNHSCFLKKIDSMFCDEKKCSSTIHAHNVFFYNIESRLEEQFECRFQIINSRGDCITLRKSCIFDNMTDVDAFKATLPRKHLECMEVVKCRSHQPTLLCVINGSQSLKKHFCETTHDNVVASFFAWMVSDVLRPTNSKKHEKNDYIFVAHNGSAYDSQFVYRNTHNFFGSQNINVLIHNNRMIELKVQVNTGFRMSMVYFKDSYKFMNLPLRLLPKSFNFHNELQKGFFLIT